MPFLTLILPLIYFQLKKIENKEPTTVIVYILHAFYILFGFSLVFYGIMHPYYNKVDYAKENIKTYFLLDLI